VQPPRSAAIVGNRRAEAGGDRLEYRLARGAFSQHLDAGNGEVFVQCQLVPSARGPERPRVRIRQVDAAHATTDVIDARAASPADFFRFFVVERADAR